MQQSIRNNRISLIVNNNIQQFEIKAPILQFSNKNLKPPLYKGNLHFGGLQHKKNHSLSIHQNGRQYMANHLKIIPTNNNKKSKLLSINSNNSNNISIAYSVNNQANSNRINSFHRPESPVVLNISSDRHCLYQQQQQNSFQHISSHNSKVSSNHQFLGQIGANLGYHPFQRDRTLNFRQNSLKVIGRLDNKLNKNKIGSINVLSSINCQKNNISQLNESPISKSKNYGMNGSSSNNMSDLEKINNSSSNTNTNNNGTIINSSSYMQMNNSLSINTNCNNNTNNNISSNIICNNHQNNTIEGNINTNNNINNITTSNNREKKYKISKTQILFPYHSRDNLTVAENQDTIKSSHKNITSQKIINNAKIINNQNFQEDEILYQKACTQPTDILREQMALETPPQFATYTTSATTDTMNRQTFRIRPYNMSSHQSSRGGQKSTITSNIPTSSVTQQENTVFDNNVDQINNISNSTINNNDITDISPNIINQNQLNKQQIPGQRILSSRNSNKISQNPRRRILRQPSFNLVPDNAANINLYHPQQNSQNQVTQKEIVVRKNSYWFNQRGQLLKKKKKEKSVSISTNEIISDIHHQNQQHTEPYSMENHEEDHKNQHFLFRFPSKEDKINCNGKEIEKNDLNNQKRENSPKGSLTKLSKRQSIVRINQKQHYMHSHQPASQISAQQFPQNQINGFQIQNNILNIKPLNFKKAQNHINSKNHENQSIRNSDPYRDVELRELLGEGAYGKVYKGFMKQTGKFIAVKQLKLSHQGLKENNIQEKLEQYHKEIALLNHLEHPNIVKYYDCKQEDDHILIFMEQMTGGSLSSMLQKFGRFEEALIKKFVKQIIQGLAYLHSQGVVHRDIKGANILSDGNGIVKLADFGAARYRDTFCLPTASGSEFCDSIKGSLYWMAPELLNQEPHGRKSDIWGLGCTIIEMATGKHPWPDCRTFIQLALVVKTDQCPPIPDHLSDVCKDFIRKCCTFDKKLRPTTDKLLQHPFLQD